MVSRFMVIGAYAANQFGWISAEAGRQPWIVYDLLRTSDALSESVTGGMVLSSLIMFGLIYAMLFVVWVYVLNNKIQHGPEPVAVHDNHTTRDELFETVARRSNPGWIPHGSRQGGIRKHKWNYKYSGLYFSAYCYSDMPC